MPSLHEVKQEFGVLSGSDLAPALRTLPDRSIVQGLIPAASISILVGDSGIGKTPLACQLALSVASGTPFLGLPVRQSKVLLVDYEDALWDCHSILEKQRRLLGLAEYPDNFLYWPAHTGPTPRLFNLVQVRVNQRGSSPTVQRLIERLAPELVILDPLRAFNPEMETNNTAAVRQIRTLRDISARLGTAFLLIHHVRKRRMRNLEEGPTLEWLLQAAGARALINQTDVRIAVALPDVGPARKSSQDIALVMRAHARTRGEIGPYLLRRKFIDGEPAGYDRLTPSAALLANPEQEKVFRRLPESFWFKDAMRIYDKHDDTTNRLLHDLVRLGLIKKVARGQYQKCVVAKSAGESNAMPLLSA